MKQAFHRALYRGARNRYLIGMLDSLATSIMLLGRTTLSLVDRPPEAHCEHEAIVDAIARHDPEAAEAHARSRIHNAHKARLRVMFEDDAEPRSEP